MKTLLLKNNTLSVLSTLNHELFTIPGSPMEIPEEAAGAGSAIRFDENSSNMGQCRNINFFGIS